MGDSRFCSLARSAYFSSWYVFACCRNIRLCNINFCCQTNQSHRRKRHCFRDSRNCFRCNIHVVWYYLCTCNFWAFRCIRKRFGLLPEPPLSLTTSAAGALAKTGALFSAKMRFYTDFTLVFFRFLHPLGILISAEKKENQIQKPKGNLL